jgi:hypothetical protein
MQLTSLDLLRHFLRPFRDLAVRCDALQSDTARHDLTPQLPGQLRLRQVLARLCA